jgi:hypothetical protein
MNAGNGRHQIGVTGLNRASGAGFRGNGRCRQFRKDVFHQLGLQLGLQLWKLALENLRYRALDDLLKFLAIRHAQRTVPNTRVFAITTPTENDTALSADYTALVRSA